MLSVYLKNRLIQHYKNNINIYLLNLKLHNVSLRIPKVT